MSTVLVVDDDPMNCELLRALLQSADCSVVTAQDGARALASASSARPDLILMDVQMPGMDGVEVLHLLRADPATASIPTIAITARAMPEDEDGLMKAGFDGYLSKPVDIDLVRETVRRHLSSAQDRSGK